MAAQKSLKKQVESEKKYVAFNQGRLSLKPKGTRTVSLQDGSFAQIDAPPIALEMEGERRMGSISRPLDPSVKADREILDLVEDLLAQRPYMATDVRYGLQIIGEYEARRPWNGYDEQTAEEARNTFMALPDVSRPKLEEMMKYELNKVVYDEDLDEEVSATDDEKVKMINALYREVEKEAKAEANETVSLD